MFSFIFSQYLRLNIFKKCTAGFDEKFFAISDTHHEPTHELVPSYRCRRKSVSSIMCFAINWRVLSTQKKKKRKKNRINSWWIPYSVFTWRHTHRCDSNCFLAPILRHGVRDVVVAVIVKRENLIIGIPFLSFLLIDLVERFFFFSSKNQIFWLRFITFK